MPEDLLPQYERELAFLRQHAGEFAQRFPRVAAQLLMAGEAGKDPHVERMIQSCALLAARLGERLDDDFSLISDSILETLYPHYLRPFPACSIACFGLSKSIEKSATAHRVARHTALKSQPVRGERCLFRTSFDVDLLPLRVAGLKCTSSFTLPEGTLAPSGAAMALSITLDLLSPQATWASLGTERVRCFIDGDAAQVGALREAMCSRVVAGFVQIASAGPWARAGKAWPAAVGFADDESLIDFGAQSHSAYRLLTEYFAFPEKFNFVDLPLPAVLLASPARSVTLHYLLAGIRPDSAEARLLETIDEKQLRLGCTPVINLFQLHADPISVSDAAERYPVLPNSRRAFAYQVYSVDKVYRVQKTAEGDVLAEYPAFNSLRHDHLQREGDSAGRYWMLHRGERLELSIVDIELTPAAPQSDSLSIQVTATNRDLPMLLPIGDVDGDLTPEGGEGISRIHLLRRPTRSQSFERGRGAHWRLVSQLSPNHLSLSSVGLEALKELLRLYDLPRSAGTRRQLDALIAIDFKPATACVPAQPVPTFMRGMEIVLSVDEAQLAGTGLRLFAQVLEQFFGLYAQSNSFTRLTVVSSHTRQTLVACAPQQGRHALI